MEYVINVLKGIVIGIANSVPGVSGGTMMVIMKVFDRLMDIISNLSVKKIIENFFFLLTIGIGMVVGILASATLLDFCFERFYVQTQFFFMGIVGGSLPSIYKEATSNGKFKKIHAAPFAAGLVLMIAVTILSFSANKDGGTVYTTLTPFTFFYMLICLCIAAAAMIMPGLSGSLVMVILGAYRTIIEAISLDNIRERWGLVIPAMLGAVLGIILCAKAITKALEKSKQGTYAVILGLIIGSFYAIFPRPENGQSITGMSIVFGIIFLILGAALPLAFDILGSRITKKEDK